jgi:hypothetical protein
MSTTQISSRTNRLLALTKKGDVAFNTRDVPGMDRVHHPDMVAQVTGLPAPVYGRAVHAAAMAQRLGPFPDMRVHCYPYPIQFGSGDWITVITNVTGTFSQTMSLPDGTVMEPTGRSFDVEFGQTTKWLDDRLVVISAFWDAAEFARQVGLDGSGQ